MTRDKFDQIQELLEGKFTVISRDTREFDDGSGGTEESVEFDGPMGRMKLVFTEKGRFIGEKTSYSRRIGGDIGIEKKYDQEDKVGYLKAYTWDEASQDWAEVDANKLAGF